jgi:hypothetical protein
MCPHPGDGDRRPSRRIAIFNSFWSGRATDSGTYAWNSRVSNDGELAWVRTSRDTRRMAQ